MSPVVAGIQQAQQAANLDLIKAQTEKTKAEATKIANVDTDAARAGIEKTIAETSNERAKKILTEYQTEQTELENQFKSRSMESAVNYASYQADEKREQVRSAQANGDIDEATAARIEESIDADITNKWLQAEATKHNIS